MARRSGQFLSTAAAADITNGSGVSGATVDDALDTLDSLKAPKANATFTGTTTVATLAVGTAATVPTAAVGDSDTTAASTAFTMQAVGLAVSVASDGAAAILNTTASLYLAETTTGSKEIAVTSRRANQRVEIRLVAASGGDYHITSAEGLHTLDAAGDALVLVRDAVDSAWLVLRNDIA
jgi:hypothetical protein